MSDRFHADVVPAIDVHGHYGNYFREKADPLVSTWMSASAEAVAARAEACGIALTIVSPLAGLLPRGSPDSVMANREAYLTVKQHPRLRQYVIINPLQPETYEQARVFLQEDCCVGIKIHPEEHGYRISDFGEELFSFFTEVKAPVMTHSGCPNSLPRDFLPFADRYPEVRLLLAHLGNGAGDRQKVDLQVRAVQASRHGNLWIDTSSSRSLLPGLIEWATREVGAERLLFGTDTPLYHAGAQVARIRAADIKDAEKRMILRENAEAFFRIKLPSHL